MKKKISILLSIVFVFSVLIAVPMETQAASEVSIKVDGQDFAYDDSLIYEGRTYIPVRQFSELVGSFVEWDGELKQVSILKDGISFQLYVDSKKVIYNGQVYYMDTPLIIRDNVTYAPIRFITEGLHYNVSWTSETSTVNIWKKPFYMVNQGDTLGTISSRFGVTVEELMEWNDLTSDEIYFGQKLILEPLEFKSAKNVEAENVISYTNEEIEWLARIIYTEARDEPYEGLLAVGAVVVNRVQSPNFPNTIYDVIFQTGQFTPAMTGLIYEITPDEEAYKAAEEALLGIDPVDGALYFYNPRISNSTFFYQKEFIIDIGNHNFYR